MRETLLRLLTFASAASEIAQVHVCGLFPKGVVGSPAMRDSGYRRLAVLQEALRAINARSDLLPNTQLLLTHRDSKCHQLTAVEKTAEMAQNAFNGSRRINCDVIIGEACSSASIGIASVATLLRVPQISYSSTSPELSKSRLYPYFARIPPSETLQSSTALSGSTPLHPMPL